jgi:hypothetical protein
VRCEAPLFVPLGAGGCFRFVPDAGGASRLEGVLTPFVAAGVAAGSAGVSAAGVGSRICATGVSDDEGVDLDDAFEDGSGVGANLARPAGDSLRTTTLDFAGLGVILVTAACEVAASMSMGAGGGLAMAMWC